MQNIVFVGSAFSAFSENKPWTSTSPGVSVNRTVLATHRRAPQELRRAEAKTGTRRRIMAEFACRTRRSKLQWPAQEGEGRGTNSWYKWLMWCLPKGPPRRAAPPSGVCTVLNHKAHWGWGGADIKVTLLQLDYPLEVGGI